MKDIFDEIQRDMDEFFQEIDKAIGRDPEEVDVITDHLPDPMTDEEVEYLEMKAELNHGIQIKSFYLSMYLQWGYGSGGFLKYIPFPTTSIILKKSEKKT